MQAEKRANCVGAPELLVNTSRKQLFSQPGHLEGWRDDTNTTVVNFMYDTTPAECITMVICEHGSVTPEGVSGVIRVSRMEW